jgi:hypothetical protein
MMDTVYKILGKFRDRTRLLLVNCCKHIIHFILGMYIYLHLIRKFALIFTIFVSWAYLKDQDTYMYVVAATLALSQWMVHLLLQIDFSLLNRCNNVLLSGCWLYVGHFHGKYFLIYFPLKEYDYNNNTILFTFIGVWGLKMTLIVQHQNTAIHWVSLHTLYTMKSLYSV